MKDQLSTFYRISWLVTASDLKIPLACGVNCQLSAFEAMEFLSTRDPEHFDIDRISLVLDGDIPTGWFWPFGEEIDEGSDKPVSEFAHPLTAAMMVASNTSYFDLADKFAEDKHFFVFVLDGTEISGTVSYLGLLSRIGQVSLLCLTFGLETAAEELCSLRAKDSWNALPEQRQRAAQEVLSRRHTDLSSKWAEPSDEVTARSLIKCTTFNDKVKILCKLRLIPTVSDTEMQSLFSLAQKVRNACAHGADAQQLYLIIPEIRFGRFLHGTQNLIESMRVLIQELSA